MITTNKIKPKENRRDDKYLEVEKDDKGELTGNIISHIPRNVLTTSQDKVNNRPARRLPHNFTDIRILDKKKPKKTFIQTSDLEDMQYKAKMEKVKAASAKLKAAKKPTAKKRGRKKKS